MSDFNNEWNKYAVAAVSDNAGEAQICETKQAFFAGAAAMIKLVAATKNVAEKEGRDAVDALTEELDGYFRALTTELIKQVAK